MRVADVDAAQPMEERATTMTYVPHSRPDSELATFGVDELSLLSVDELSRSSN